MGQEPAASASPSSCLEVPVRAHPRLRTHLNLHFKEPHSDLYLSSASLRDPLFWRLWPCANSDAPVNLWSSTQDYSDMQSSILHFEVESDSLVHVYPTLQSGYAYKVSLGAGALRESLRKKNQLTLACLFP